MPLTRVRVCAGCEQVLVSHALFCAPPTPSKLVLSKQQGDVMLVGMAPGLNKDHSKMSDDHLESGSVPFRMTRMMTILLSSVGLQGGFSAAMGAAAMALTHPQRMLKQHLYSVLREEILSYGFPQPKPGQPLQSARIEYGKLVNHRAIECAGQVRPLPSARPERVRGARCMCCPVLLQQCTPYATPMANERPRHVTPCADVCGGLNRWSIGYWRCHHSTQPSNKASTCRTQGRCRLTRKYSSSCSLLWTPSSRLACPASGILGHRRDRAGGGGGVRCAFGLRVCIGKS